MPEAMPAVYLCPPTSLTWEASPDVDHLNSVLYAPGCQLHQSLNPDKKHLNYIKFPFCLPLYHQSLSSIGKLAAKRHFSETGNSF